MLGGNLGSLLYGDVSVMFVCFPIIKLQFLSLFELCHEKTCLQGFQPGSTQTGLYVYSHRRWLKRLEFWI